MINMADHVYTVGTSLLEALHHADPSILDNPEVYKENSHAVEWWIISATLSRALPRECPVVTCCGNYFVPQTARLLSEDKFLSGAADVF